MKDRGASTAKSFVLVGKFMLVAGLVVVLLVSLDVLIGLGWGFSVRDLGLALAILILGIAINLISIWFFRQIGALEPKTRK